MKAIRIEAGDITIEPLDVDQCEDCDNDATRKLMLDLRALGTAVPLGVYCSACGAHRHSRAVESLAGAK